MKGDPHLVERVAEIMSAMYRDSNVPFDLAAVKQRLREVKNKDLEDALRVLGEAPWREGTCQ